MKIPKTEIEVEYTRFEGGLDQETPYLTFPPGAIFSSKNYVPTAVGGYKRIDGYERYDGQPSPSDADYKHLVGTFDGNINEKDTIIGSTSGATGIIINYSYSKINVTKISGTFQQEDITIDGEVIGTISSVESGEADVYEDAVALHGAANVYRDDITKPSGDQPIRGVCMYKGSLYAFTDNENSTAGQIYKESTSGWTEISLYHELYFDSGTGLIADGDLITQTTSGATATVKRVVKTSGVWGTDAAGKLILSDITGTFNDTDTLEVDSSVQATSTSTADQITINPEGRYEFVLYNFSADIDRERVYGCDGKNRSFEFDGDVYVPLDIPVSTDAIDKPLHINAHKKQLFLHYESGVIHSGVGYPYEYTAISGANAISLSDRITGSHVLPGQALAIFARNETAQLLGNNIDDFKLDSISNEVGAIPYTIQRMGQVFSLDDRGIVMVSPTDSYGNFTQGTISRKIQTLINQMRKVVVASGVYRSEDQYRLYGSDGTGVCMTRVGDRFDFSYFEYPDNVSCVFCGEDENGKDVVFFGTDEGWIMQADKGSSFDDEDIEAYFSLPFNNSKSPTTLKTYRKGTIEMSCLSYVELKFSTTLSYGSTYYEENPPEAKAVQGPGGFWDVSSWNDFVYNQEFIASPSIHINGTGLNMSLSVYSKSSIDLGHKLDGIIIHYTLRRLSR